MTGPTAANRPTLRRRALTAWRTRGPVLYPAAILALPVLDLYAGNDVSPFAVLRPLLVAAAAGLALAVVGSRLTGDRDRGGFAAGVIALALVGGREPPFLVLLLLPLLVLLLERLWARRLRRPLRWPSVTRAMTIVVAVLLIAVGLKTAQEGRLSDLAYDVVHEGPLRGAVQPAPPAASPELPDIYLILLDGYLRPDRQATLLSHDDSTFVAALQDRGFEVPPASRSNYLFTHWTLASMLNVKHIDEIVAAPGLRGGGDPDDSRYWINEAPVLDTVRQRGYEVIGVSPGWEEVALRRADRFVDTGQLNEAETILVRKTAVGALLDLAAPGALAEQHRARVGDVLDAAADVAGTASERPRFVLAHVPSPHEPFVFRADGSPHPMTSIDDYSDVSSLVASLGRRGFGSIYAEQVDHVNRLVLEVVDRIRAESVRPAVIVVFSDHGSASGLDTETGTIDDLDERTAVLVAVASTDGRDLVADRVTLINVLPSILNEYLGTGYAPQDESSYLVPPADPAALTRIEDLPP